MSVVTRLQAFFRNQSGQDLLEYALLVALIALVVVGALTTTGTNLSTAFTNISNAFPA
jgi:pilus assembly protein Flp/PilA